ncbi:WD domain [Entamoeba marina]
MPIRLSFSTTFSANVVAIHPSPVDPELVLFQTNTHVVHIYNTTTHESVKLIDSHVSDVLSCCWVEDNVFVSYNDGVIIHYDTEKDDVSLFSITRYQVYSLMGADGMLFGLLSSPKGSKIIQFDKKGCVSLVVSRKNIIYSFVVTEHGILTSEPKASKNPLVLSRHQCNFKRKYIHPYENTKQSMVIAAVSTAGEVYFINTCAKSTFQFMKKVNIEMNCIGDIAINSNSVSWDSIQFCLCSTNHCVVGSTDSIDKNNTFTAINSPITSFSWSKQSVCVASRCGSLTFCEIIEN